MLDRLNELRATRNLRDRIVFTGTYNRLTSIDVRARQMAEPLGAIYVRGRHLTASRVRGARCLIWVATADSRLVREIGRETPQIFDVINPSIEKGEPYFELVNEFDTLIVNTRSTMEHLPRRRPGGWRVAVIPHHHCNVWGFTLPEERVERPRTVGYVGQPEHLHDLEAIRATVESLGMRFVACDTRDLAGYKDIDIGVAWTRPDSFRYSTRSNIKLTNFCAFGIPSVVANYESYADVDRALDGGACLRADNLTEFLEGLRTLAADEELRREMNSKAEAARAMYSVEEIARQYAALVEQISPRSATSACRG